MVGAFEGAVHADQASVHLAQVLHLLPAVALDAHLALLLLQNTQQLLVHTQLGRDVIFLTAVIQRALDLLVLGLNRSLVAQLAD